MKLSLVPAVPIRTDICWLFEHSLQASFFYAISMQYPIASYSIDTIANSSAIRTFTMWLYLVCFFLSVDVKHQFSDKYDALQYFCLFIRWMKWLSQQNLQRIRFEKSMQHKKCTYFLIFSSESCFSVALYHIISMVLEPRWNTDVFDCTRHKCVYIKRMHHT